MNSPRSGNTKEPNLYVAAAIFIVAPVLWFIYTNQSSELKETKRYSKFQSYVIACKCEPSGVGYTPDGVEETEYFCIRNGETIAYSDYAQELDQSYEPRNSGKSCPR